MTGVKNMQGTPAHLEVLSNKNDEDRHTYKNCRWYSGGDAITV